jgi:hypothetical protein
LTQSPQIKINKGKMHGSQLLHGLTRRGGISGRSGTNEFSTPCRGLNSKWLVQQTKKLVCTGEPCVISTRRSFRLRCWSAPLFGWIRRPGACSVLAPPSRCSALLLFSFGSFLLFSFCFLQLVRVCWFYFCCCSAGADSLFATLFIHHS